LGKRPIKRIISFVEKTPEERTLCEVGKAKGKWREIPSQTIWKSQRMPGVIEKEEGCLGEGRMGRDKYPCP